MSKYCDGSCCSCMKQANICMNLSLTQFLPCCKCWGHAGLLDQLRGIFSYFNRTAVHRELNRKDPGIRWISSSPVTELFQPYYS